MIPELQNIASIMFCYDENHSNIFRVLKNHGATIPEEGLYMIRFHSFYPWHTGRDYQHLSNEKDEKMLKWVNEFK